MKKPLIFALRGAVGFGLTGAILLLGIMNMMVDRVPENLIYRERHTGEAPCIGEWRQDWGIITEARFGEDGSFALRGVGGLLQVKGVYHMADATTARLEPATPWATARVVIDPGRPYYPELRVANASGTEENLTWFRRSASEPEMFAWTQLTMYVAAVVRAGVLDTAIACLGMDHWKRAAAGFGLSLVPTIILVVLTTAFVIDSPFLFRPLAALAWGAGYALLGAVGGRCLRRDLAWPGAVAFGMPGAFFGLLGLLASDPLLAFLFVGLPLAMGGGIFGIALGRPVSAPRATPPQPG